MTTKAAAYVLDNGLIAISGGTIKLALCQTEPLTLSDCTSLSGSGGKRISTEISITGEVTLSDGINISSRKVTIPSKTFTDGILVGVTSGTANLWLVVYSAGQLLLKTDGVVDRELLTNTTFVSPPFDFGIQQV